MKGRRPVIKKYPFVTMHNENHTKVRFYIHVMLKRTPLILIKIYKNGLVIFYKISRNPTNYGYVTHFMISVALSNKLMPSHRSQATEDFVSVRNETFYSIFFPNYYSFSIVLAS